MESKPAFHKSAVAIIYLALTLALCALFWDSSILSHSYVAKPFANTYASEWRPSISLVHNAFIMWRLDPFVSGVYDLYTDTSVSALWPAFSLQLFIFSLGLFSLFSYSGRKGVFVWSAVVALLIPIGITWIFGFDVVVLSSLTWIPWFTLSLLLYGQERVPKGIALLLILLFAWRIAVSANQLAPLSLALGYLTAAFWSRNNIVEEPERRVDLLVVVLSFLPCLIEGFFTNSPPFPAYPALGRVVPDDGLPGVIRPLIGSDGVIPAINRAVVRTIYGKAGMLCILGIVAGYFIELLFRRKKLIGSSNAYLLWAAFLALLVVFDSFPHESIAQILPLEVLPRIIPGLAFFPLSPIALAFSLLLVGAYTIVSRRFMPLVLSFISLILVPVNSPLSSPAISLTPAPLQVVDEKIVISNKLDNRLVSPSLSVVKSYGHSVLTVPTVSVDDFIPLKRFKPTIKTSHKNKERAHKRMLDRNLKTRWSPGYGKQTGDEWVFVKLAEQKSIKGIMLLTGNFRSDFPRGLSIQSAELCSADSPFEEIQFKDLVMIPSWQGSISHTKNGYPYYTGQEKVIVVFPEEHASQCILIKQTASEPNFDWSVAEIKLLCPNC